jgi:Tol biopolymer transport system component
MRVRYLGLAVAAGTAAVVMGAPAHAATAHSVAFVRAGSIYLLSGTTSSRLTQDADDTRPRWSPDRRRIAYGHAGRLWAINADGTGRQALTSFATSGADWSPDGRWLAFAAPGCTGIDGVFRVAATGGPAQPLFPAACRGTAAPAPTRRPKASGDLAARLRADGSVAWSPDGTRIAFPGGDCVAVSDDCLTVGNVASGTEEAVAAYGGGGQIFSGFAVVPAWRPDGQRLSWTAAQDGADPATTQPVHVVEADPSGTGARTVGRPLDREMVYDGTGRGVLTGQYRGASWLFAVDLATGARTPLVPGSQPSV